MLNLQKRLHISFAAALALVMITGATALYYIRQFDQRVYATLIADIELAEYSGVLERMLQELTISSKAFFASPDDTTKRAALVEKFGGFIDGIQQAQALSRVEQNKAIHEEIIADGNRLRPLIDDIAAGVSLPSTSNAQIRAFVDRSTKRMETIQNQFQQEMDEHRTTIDRLFSSAQQNQILIIIVVLVGGVFLSFFMPRRAVWPFRRLLQAFHEAWECNLSVRLPARGSDELAELSRGFNHMMAQLEELDEMKVKRIAFERRRFEVLANALNMGVILLTIEGKIVFINSPVYRVLDVTSTQVLNRDLESAPLPEKIVEIFQEALSTKQRIEDRPWQGTFTAPSGQMEKHDVSIDVLPVRTHAGDLVNLLMLIRESDVPVEKRLFQREVHAGRIDVVGSDKK